jgi:hypothetical protein
VSRELAFSLSEARKIFLYLSLSAFSRPRHGYAGKREYSWLIGRHPGHPD